MCCMYTVALVFQSDSDGTCSCIRAFSTGGGHLPLGTSRCPLCSFPDVGICAQHVLGPRIGSNECLVEQIGSFVLGVVIAEFQLSRIGNVLLNI